MVALVEAIHLPIKLILNDIRAGKFKGFNQKQTWTFLESWFCWKGFYGILIFLPSILYFLKKS